MASGAVVLALGVGAPQQSGAYCDPKYDRCTNDCTEMQKKLERVSPLARQLISCPQ